MTRTPLSRARAVNALLRSRRGDETTHRHRCSALADSSARPSMPPGPRLLPTARPGQSRDVWTRWDATPARAWDILCRNDADVTTLLVGSGALLATAVRRCRPSRPHEDAIFSSPSIREGSVAGLPARVLVKIYQVRLPELTRRRRERPVRPLAQRAPPTTYVQPHLCASRAASSRCSILRSQGLIDVCIYTP